jgi:hypothetical protein
VSAPQPPIAPPEGPVIRPGALRWFWYSLGGSLPPRFSPWIYQDATSRTWVVRHLVRALVQLAIPIALVLLVLPGPFWIRAMAAIGGVLLGLIFSVAYMTETVEHRLVRAGYPAGSAAEAHQRAAQRRDEERSARVHEAAGRRAARYRARSGQ